MHNLTKPFRIAAVLALMVICGGAFAFYQSIYWRIEQSNTKFNQKVAVLETAYLSDVNTSGTLTVIGNTTLGGTVSLAGTITVNTGVVDYNTTTSARTILAAENGKVFTVSAIAGADAANDKVTFNLPTAAAGLSYTFIDNDADANNDLWITAAAGDKINNGTAAKSYVSGGDAFGDAVTLVAIDATNWVVISKLGTWANDNN